MNLYTKYFYDARMPSKDPRHIYHGRGSVLHCIWSSTITLHWI